VVYSTEVFVMIIYIIGVPLFAGVIRSADLPGAGLFITAYLFLVLSNTFTVVEGLWFESLFNFLEHASITISSMLFFAATSRLLAADQNRNNQPPVPGAASD